MSTTLGVAELKRRFAEMLDRISMRHEQLLIERRGKVVAAMVPADLLDTFTGSEETAGRRGLLAAAGAWADHPDPKSLVESARKPGGKKETD
jgi:antitoxin (DNA-binding transcriptional repressor) of toxin-antitoxin stability system